MVSPVASSFWLTQRVDVFSRILVVVPSGRGIVSRAYISVIHDYEEGDLLAFTAAAHNHPACFVGQLCARQRIYCHLFKSSVSS